MITIDDARVRQLASGFHIPPRPEILVRLQAEQQAEYPDLQVIADLIAADISLSACVLKTINSPVFGLNRSITDIRQSVMLLGLKNIVPLVTFFALRNAMAGRQSCISLERFWDTAIDTANVMVLLLQRMQLVQPPEDVYAAGLFHDCGIPLMAERYPDYKELLHKANTTPDQRITQLEMAHYHTSHAVVGYFVATSWHLPRHTCELILRQHDPSLLQDKTVDTKVKEIFALYKLAESLLTEFRRFKLHTDWAWARDSVLFYLELSDYDYNELRSEIFEQMRDLL